MTTKELNTYFDTLENELAKDVAWNDHITTDVAILMIDLLANFEDISFDEKDKIFEYYQELENDYLDTCDWVIKMKTESISMLVINSYERIKILHI